MMASAGEARSDEARIAEIVKLEMSAFCIKEGTLLRDFQTVGCGKSSLTPLTAQGEERLRATGSINTNSTQEMKQLITKKDYLVDADFIVVLKGDAALVDRYFKALLRPKWMLFLGKKCCLPAVSIPVAVYSTEDEIMGYVSGEARQLCPVDTDGQIRVSCVQDVKTAAEADDVLLDVPIRFGCGTSGYKRRFVKRDVVVIPAKEPV
jgi:CRISPR system Cascade subunit CasD